jgi:hypothetical protein
MDHRVCPVLRTCIKEVFYFAWCGMKLIPFVDGSVNFGPLVAYGVLTIFSIGSVRVLVCWLLIC